MGAEEGKAPDPSVNTTPGSTTQGNEETIDDFADLDVEMTRHPETSDNLEFDGNEPEDTDLGNEGGEEKKEEASKEEPAKEEASKEEPAKGEEKAEPDPDIKEKVDAWELFDKSLEDAPLEVVDAILTEVRKKRPDLVDAYLREVTGETEQGTKGSSDDFDVKTYEPNGEMEEALKTRWEHIETIPALVDHANRMAEALTGTQQTLTQHAAEANVNSQIALAQIEALAEALGLQLDWPDEKAIAQELATGKVTYKDAVRKHVDYKTAVAKKKQADTPRPDTPGNESKRVEPIKEGTSMLEISRRMGFMPRR